MVAIKEMIPSAWLDPTSKLSDPLMVEFMMWRPSGEKTLRRKQNAILSEVD